MSTAVETKAQSHREELAKLEMEVEALRQQLRHTQRLATLGTMTAMVAHEFNNILTPMINYAQLARSNPALVDKAIMRAADDGLRATEICGAILGLTDGSRAAPTEVNLDQLVRRTVAAMGRDPRKDGIEMPIDIPANLVIRIRRIELQQVVLNLIMNARSAVIDKAPPRLVRVWARRKRKRLVLRVSDNGGGIAAKHLSKIFEPFFTTKQGGNGSTDGRGLGLAICRQIVAALGGRIEVESTPGQGAAFTVSVPA
ncbi:MAG: HAMP domain-containing histidine kinase [Phycisphaerae bacterium]|nr:HAMP domain-containing histidine kinase [Phycisphaerae bacterium]